MADPERLIIIGNAAYWRGRAEECEARLAAYENLRAAAEKLEAWAVELGYLQDDNSMRDALDRLDQEKP